jgi:hypothetical protein
LPDLLGAGCVEDVEFDCGVCTQEEIANKLNKASSKTAV